MFTPLNFPPTGFAPFAQVPPCYPPIGGVQPPYPTAMPQIPFLNQFMPMQQFTPWAQPIAPPPFLRQGVPPIPAQLPWVTPFGQTPFTPWNIPAAFNRLPYTGAFPGVFNQLPFMNYPFMNRSLETLVPKFGFPPNAYGLDPALYGEFGNGFGGRFQDIGLGGRIGSQLAGEGFPYPIDFPVQGFGGFIPQPLPSQLHQPQLNPFLGGMYGPPFNEFVPRYGVAGTPNVGVPGYTQPAPTVPVCPTGAAS